MGSKQTEIASDFFFKLKKKSTEINFYKAETNAPNTFYAYYPPLSSIYSISLTFQLTYYPG